MGRVGRVAISLIICWIKSNYWGPSIGNPRRSIRFSYRWRHHTTPWWHHSTFGTHCSVRLILIFLYRFSRVLFPILISLPSTTSSWLRHHVMSMLSVLGRMGRIAEDGYNSQIILIQFKLLGAFIGNPTGSIRFSYRWRHHSTPWWGHSTFN